MFEEFCSNMNFQQCLTPSYQHHQSSDHVEAGKKFVKHSIDKCPVTNENISQALLQIWSTPAGARLPSPAIVLFSRPIWGLLPQMNREAINIDNYDGHYESLEHHQKKYNKDNDTQ